MKQVVFHARYHACMEDHNTTPDNAIPELPCHLRDEPARSDDSQSFEQSLASLINQHSRENGSNTPDFLLAEFMVSTLGAFETLMQKRAKWYSSTAVDDEFIGTQLNDHQPLVEYFEQEIAKVKAIAEKAMRTANSAVRALNKVNAQFATTTKIAEGRVMLGGHEGVLKVYGSDEPPLDNEQERNEVMSKERMELKPVLTDSERLDVWFQYHAPKEGQPEKYERIRAAGKAMAVVLLECCPPSADRTAAIRKIREAVYTANAAVACDGV